MCRPDDFPPHHDPALCAGLPRCTCPCDECVRIRARIDDQRREDDRANDQPPHRNRPEE